jgi:hypothetical protein
MDILKVLAVYARWHGRIKAFCRGENAWDRVLAEYHDLQRCNRWLYEAAHLRHCPEHADLMAWLPAAERAVAAMMADLDRGDLTRAEVKLTIGSSFYRTVGRCKIALHALHQMVEEPMGLRDTVSPRSARKRAPSRGLRLTAAAS